MTRLTFKNLDENTLTNSKRLLFPDGFIYFTLDIKNLTYNILNVKGNKVLKSGGEKTLGNCKKSIKNTLKELGVTFNDDIRNHMKEEVLNEQSEKL